MRCLKMLGLAAFAGVAATGVVIIRDQCRRSAYTPEEVRDQLHARLAETHRPPAPVRVPGISTELSGLSPARCRQRRADRARLPDHSDCVRDRTERWVPIPHAQPLASARLAVVPRKAAVLPEVMLCHRGATTTGVGSFHGFGSRGGPGRNAVIAVASSGPVSADQWSPGTRVNRALGSTAASASAEAA
jgi:hypothetical protein